MEKGNSKRNKADRKQFIYPEIIEHSISHSEQSKRVQGTKNQNKMEINALESLRNMTPDREEVDMSPTKNDCLAPWFINKKEYERFPARKKKKEENYGNTRALSCIIPNEDPTENNNLLKQVNEDLIPKEDHQKPSPKIIPFSSISSRSQRHSTQTIERPIAQELALLNNISKNPTKDQHNARYIPEECPLRRKTPAENNNIYFDHKNPSTISAYRGREKMPDSARGNQKRHEFNRLTTKFAEIRGLGNICSEEEIIHIGNKSYGSYTSKYAEKILYGNYFKEQMIDLLNNKPKYLADMDMDPQSSSLENKIGGPPDGQSWIEGFKRRKFRKKPARGGSYKCELGLSPPLQISSCAPQQINPTLDKVIARQTENTFEKPKTVLIGLTLSKQSKEEEKRKGSKTAKNWTLRGKTSGRKKGKAPTPEEQPETPIEISPTIKKSSKTMDMEEVKTESNSPRSHNLQQLLGIKEIMEINSKNIQKYEENINNNNNNNTIINEKTFCMNPNKVQIPNRNFKLTIKPSYRSKRRNIHKHCRSPRIGTATTNIVNNNNNNIITNNNNNIITNMHTINRKRATKTEQNFYPSHPGDGVLGGNMGQRHILTQSVPHSPFRRDHKEYQGPSIVTLSSENEHPHRELGYPPSRQHVNTMKISIPPNPAILRQIRHYEFTKRMVQGNLSSDPLHMLNVRNRGGSLGVGAGVGALSSCRNYDVNIYSNNNTCYGTGTGTHELGGENMGSKTDKELRHIQLLNTLGDTNKLYLTEFCKEPAVFGGGFKGNKKGKESIWNTNTTNNTNNTNITNITNNTNNTNNTGNTCGSVSCRGVSRDQGNIPLIQGVQSLQPLQSTSNTAISVAASQTQDLKRLFLKLLEGKKKELQREKLNGHKKARGQTNSSNFPVVRGNNVRVLTLKF